MLEWTPADALAAEAVRSGDAAALDALVRAEPLPPNLLEALAMRAFAADPARCRRMASGREAADPRWRRALALRIAATPPPSPLDQAVVLTLPAGRAFASATPLGGGLLAREVDGRLHGVDLGPIALDLGSAWALPLPLAPAERRALLVEPQHEQLLTARILAPDGSLSPPLIGQLGGRPHGWAATVRGVRLHGPKGVAWLHPEGPGPSLPAIWPYPPAPVQSDDGRLLLAVQEAGAARVGAWWAESGEVERSAPWSGRVSALLAQGALLWIASPTGLFTLDPAGTLHQEAEGEWDALIAGGAGTVALGAAGMRVLPHGPTLPWGPRGRAFRGWPVGRRLLLEGGRSWWILRPSGQEGAAAADEGEVSLSRMLDGSVGVLCGNDLVILDSMGEIRARARSPFDGAIYGATEAALIVGTVRAGNSRQEADRWLAWDAECGLISSLPAAAPRRPTGTTTALGPSADCGLIRPEALWWLDGARLLRWAPDPHARIDALPALRPARVLQGQTELRHQTSNPRDDWPLAGLLIEEEDLLAVDCAWGGTWGALPGPDVGAMTGSVGVLWRCRFAGSGELDLAPAASLILVQPSWSPTHPRMGWLLHPHATLALVGAEACAGVQVRLEAGARLWMDGRLVAQGPTTWTL